MKTYSIWLALQDSDLKKRHTRKLKQQKLHAMPICLSNEFVIEKIGNILPELPNTPECDFKYFWRRQPEPLF